MQQLKEQNKLEGRFFVDYYNICLQLKKGRTNGKYFFYLFNLKRKMLIVKGVLKAMKLKIKMLIMIQLRKLD